jgi:two-component system, LytTR family, response regulator
MLAKRIRTIIVDDEKPSRVALATYLADFCHDIEIVAECDSVKTAYNAIKDKNPDLLFLDIEMPNGNGFDLLRLFNILPFRVIFVTAFSEYAIRAFRFSASDYLLKPVKVDELVEAVQKVKNELRKEISQENLNVLMNSLGNRNGELRQLVIRDTKGFTVVKTSDLIMCEADGYCTVLHLAGNRKITCTKNIGHYEELFDQKQMVKVHRSYLINPARVTGYSRQGEIYLEENLICPLGDHYKMQFLERYRG